MSEAAARCPDERNAPEVEAAYARVPEHEVAEIIDGELFVLPRPSPRHALAAGALNEKLGPPFKRGRVGPGGWILLPEPELHLGPAEQTLEVYRLEGERFALVDTYDGPAQVRAEPFDAIEPDLAVLWAW